MDPALLWLWCGVVAKAPIGPLAWEPPNVAGASQEMAKRPKKKKKKETWESCFGTWRTAYWKLG